MGKENKGDILKDIIKIRLSMWDMKINYSKEDENICAYCVKMRI